MTHTTLGDTGVEISLQRAPLKVPRVHLSLPQPGEDNGEPLFITFPIRGGTRAYHHALESLESLSLPKGDNLLLNPESYIPPETVREILEKFQGRRARDSSTTIEDVLSEYCAQLHDTPYAVASMRGLTKLGETEELTSIEQVTQAGGLSWIDVVVDTAGDKLHLNRVVQTISALLGENESEAVAVVRYRNFFLSELEKDGIGKDKVYFVLNAQTCFTVRGAARPASNIEELFAEAFDSAKQLKIREESSEVSPIEMMCVISGALDKGRSRLFYRLKRRIEQLNHRRKRYGRLHGDEAKLFTDLQFGIGYMQTQLDHHGTDLLRIRHGVSSIPHHGESDLKNLDTRLQQHKFSTEAVETSAKAIAEIVALDAKEDADVSRRLTDTYRKYGLMFAPLTAVSLMMPALDKVLSQFPEALRAVTPLQNMAVVLATLWIPAYAAHIYQKAKRGYRGKGRANSGSKSL